MELYSESKEYKLYHGNMLDMLDVIKPNSIDSIITDPPYELNFMNRSWDNSGIAFNKEAWQKCFDVLKPGGYLLAFGGSRTFHRIAVAIEDAGFEIRDTIMYLYGSGFPKSLNVGLAIDKKMGVESIELEDSPNARPSGNKENNLYNLGTVGKEFKVKIARNEWNGWGTCLKPAYEPIIVARKPVEISVVDNVLKYGVGGMNIDECRVPVTYQDEYDLEQRQVSKASIVYNDGRFLDGLHKDETKHGVVEEGRFPANVIHDGSYEATKDMPNSKSNGSDYDFEKVNQDNPSHLYTNIKSGKHFEDEGSSSRYFYCAKASMKDRDEGLENFESQKAGCMTANNNGLMSLGRASLEGNPKEIQPKKNIHPTVKPTELMQYLVRLVSPKGATILDCFNGSGSTGKAVMFENKERQANYKYIGIELTEEYLPISKARIEYVINNDFDFWKDENNRTQHEVIKKEEKLTNIFDFL